MTFIDTATNAVKHITYVGRSPHEAFFTPDGKEVWVTVKCSHGSTTGRLSEEEVFYLESRGLSTVDAREMLVVGYFEDLLASAPERYRDDALARIREKLRLPNTNAA